VAIQIYGPRFLSSVVRSWVGRTLDRVFLVLLRLRSVDRTRGPACRRQFSQKEFSPGEFWLDSNYMEL
jgi:hypothetical protein